MMPKYILAIDPGTTDSGWMVYDCENRRPHRDEGVDFFGKTPNEDVLGIVSTWADPARRLVIEMVRHYGSKFPVGDSVFRTCVWVGRYEQVWFEKTRESESIVEIYRQDEFRHILTRPTGTDAMLRQALIDRYPATGGGKTPQIGVSSQRGPLFGIRKDAWAALAIAETYMSIQELTARGERLG